MRIHNIVFVKMFNGGNKFLPSFYTSRQSNNNAKDNIGDPSMKISVGNIYYSNNTFQKELNNSVYTILLILFEIAMPRFIV